jgi:hypothetical protein
MQMGAYNTGSILGVWQATSSQGSTPVSVSITTVSSAGVGSISQQQLGISGVFLGGAATGVSNTARFQVNITVQY